MDFERVEQLIQLVEKSGLSGLAVEDGDFKVEIKKAGGAPDTAAAPVKAAPKTPPAETSNLTAIKSPMTGTFYAAAAPNNPPFVAAGDRISKGQTVCVIEAMKTFNEIEADSSGVLEKILVSNSQVVELGQPLFLLRE